MKKTMTRLFAMLTALVLAAPLASAEDTDIFSGFGGSGGAPNVLFVVDSRASNDATVSPYTCSYAPLSNGKMLDMLQCGLMMAINNINGQPSLSGKISMAIMVAHPRWFYPDTWPPYFTLMDSAGVASMTAALQTDPKSKDGIKERGNGSLGEEMWEAWAFLSGKGHQGPLQKPYTTSQFGSQSCQKSFIILIGNVDDKHDNNSNSAGGNVSDLQNAIDPAATTAQRTKINTSTIGTATGEDNSSIDEWARYLHQTNFGTDPDDPQGAITYTIGTYGEGIWADKAQQLKSTAIQGGGKSFFVNDLGTLTNVLGQIFNEIAAVNTAFASSSLPVAANAQGAFLNQVFMGQFRPDGNGGPRWVGNLKQYQFAVSGTAPNEILFLADAVGAAAISGAGTGFISSNAQSFWTKKDTNTLPDSVGGFWLNSPTGVGQGFDFPDGEMVNKGGAAQQLRLANLQDNYTTNPHSPRNVYTCTSGCGNGSSLSGFNFATDNASLTDTSLGITAPTSAVSSLSRAGGTVTAVLTAAPSPALTTGQTVAIQGAAYPELNGSFSISLVNATTFTYSITESPPQTVGSAGTYTASLPSNPQTITSLTRVGTGSGTAQSRVTATVTGHGYSVGQNVTIAGANGAQYNGTFPIATVPNANTFTYLLTDGPSTPGGGGTATQGATVLNIPANAITRGSTAVNLSTSVTVNYGTGLPSGKFGAGTSVTIAGATSSAYNGTYTITAGNANNSCGFNGSSGKNVFCFSMTSLPATPDTSGAKTVDSTATSSITLTHPVTCTGGSPSPNTTVTATTAANHSFLNGNSISIAGNPVGPNESRYVGTFTIGGIAAKTFTYPITVSPSLCTFSTAGVTAATTTGGADKNSLINWVRGHDNVGDEQSPGNGITIRPSVHGDVLHSRPTVINYGSSTGVVVYYGANDGTFRAVNGNQPLGNGNPIGGAPPGGEIWSFIPTEYYKKLKRLYLDSPQLKMANTPTGITPTPLPKDYFFDGSIGVYQGGGNVYLFLSGRRGVDENGKGFVYALDVSDPADPKYLWKHVSGESADFAELGQTWSTPKVAFVKGHVDGSGNPLPVVVFGGGFDTNQDSDPPAATTDSIGRAIYVLDAADGSLVWKAAFSSGGGAGSCTGNPCNLSDMLYSIPSDITLLNRDYDLNPGYIDRLYAADIGGNIWRVDLEPSTGTAPSNWKVTKFASVGGTGSPKRKFFFPPDVVTTKTFDMVLAATGDREHPLYSASTSSSYAVKNRFYGLKDPNIGKEVAAGSTTITDGTSSTGTAVPSGLTHVVPPTTLYDPATVDNGFYIDFPNAGEKGVNAPTTVGGFSYFGTSTPPLPTSQACTNLGTARGYQVNFLTGDTRSNVIDGGGLPPSPVAGLVEVELADGTEKTFPFLLGPNPDPSCQGPDCTSSFGGSRPPVPIPPTRRRVYWFVDKHDN